jgi:tripartite-type tricarboxylate transporter receptor subunit TctC
MNSITIGRSIALLLAAGVLFAATLPVSGAYGQTYPVKPIRIIEPAGPGSSVDVFARKVAAGLTERLGQQVLVINRPGANSAIGAKEAAGAAPDGYTVLHANTNNMLNDLLSADTCCRLNEAFIPVTHLTTTPLIVVVHPSLPVANMKDYIALAKAKPQALTYASGGTGSITQLLGEHINTRAGISVRDIAYKAIGAELPDLIGGQVMTAYLNPVVVAQFILSGKLRGLGIAGPRRLTVIPAVPTLAEAGLPGVEALVWNGLFVPAGTPQAIIDRLHLETSRTLNTPLMKTDAANQSYELSGNGGKEFAAFVRAVMGQWAKVIKDSNIKLE